MKQTTPFAKLVLLLALVGALALAGCGGDDGLSAADQARIDQAEADKLAAEQQAERDRMAAEQAERDRMAAEQAERDRRGSIEAARQAIAAADTAEAAQAAYDAVKDDANATEAAALMQAVQDRTAALATMDSATQQLTVLMGAAGNVDVTAFDLTTAEGIAAAEVAIAALQAALAAAVDVSDADKGVYQLQLDAATAPVTVARAEADRVALIASAMEAIAAAGTAEAAQEAYDAVKDDATATEGAGLQAAVDTRIDELATMGRADTQMMALTTTAGNIDLTDLSTAEAVAAANTAIAALEVALAAAVDVSEADKAMYQSRVTAAKNAVMTAQGVLDHTAQTMALASAVSDLQAIDLSDLTTQTQIDAADVAITMLREALAAATELSGAEKSAAMAELATASRTVMMAQGRVDTAGQKMMLSEAVNALDAIALDALMTAEDIRAAEEAIIALDLALEAATDLTDAEKLDATVDVTLAKRRVMTAKEALTTNIKGQTDALTRAGTTLGEINLDDLDTSEKITAANEAVEALKMALEGATHVSDSDKAMYQTQLEMATETVKTAQTGMDLTGRMAAQRTALTNAMMTARTAVAGVDNDSTDSEVAAADTAITNLQAAIDGAEDLSEGDADVATAEGTLDTLTGLLTVAKTARTDYLAEKGDEDMKAATATGKALHAALAGPSAAATALDNIDSATTPVTLSATGLVIDAAAGAGALPATGDGSNPPAVTLEAGDSAGMLGSWDGMNYSHTNTGTKVMNEAVVYTNQGAPRSVSFADAGYTVAPETISDAIKDYVFVIDGGIVQSGFDVADVMADAFAHSGRQSHQIPENRVALIIPGTYDGAPGQYRCTGTCTSTNDGKGSPSELGGDWYFKPNAGAMVSQPDANYLFYGWWVSKDKDGMPTAASAFTGVVGTIGALDSAATPPTLATSGSAIYTGAAAGKFAISNPLDGTGDGGHFTADATLTAKFGGEGAGISGMIDTFMANGKSVPWSVALNNTGTTGTEGTPASNISTVGAITAIADNTDTDDVNEAMSTVWSIDGNSAAASGTWSGQMYDEMPGGPGDDPAGDGSNIPTTVTGTFYSEFSTIGRIVGAFGADKQDKQ